MNTSVQLLNKMQKKEYKVTSVSDVEASLIPAKKAFRLAKQLLPAIQQKNRISFNDQIAFPTEIFYLNLQFLQSVIQLNNSLAEKDTDHSAIQQKSVVMKNALVNLRNKLAAGSGWEKWKEFYKPENFRIHTPPPTIEMIDKIIAGL